MAGNENNNRTYRFEDKPGFATNVFQDDPIRRQSIEDNIFWMKVSFAIFLVSIAILVLILSEPVPDRVHAVFEKIETAMMYYITALFPLRECIGVLSVTGLCGDKYIYT